MTLLKLGKKIAIKPFSILATWCQEYFYSLVDINGYHEKDSLWQEIGHRFTSLWGGESPSQDRNAPRILIEGLMTGSGPNYLYRLCLHANAAKTYEHNAKIECVFDGYRYLFRREEWLLRMAGCSKFHFLGRNFFRLADFIRAIIPAIQTWNRIQSPDDLLWLNFKNICFGDLLYDDCLKTNTKSKTIKSLNLTHLNLIYRAMILILKYQRFFTKNRYKYYIATHPCYLHYGIMCRTALQSGAKLILTTDIEANLIDKKINSDSGWSPVYHEYVDDFIRGELEQISTQDIQSAKDYLQKRFLGTIDQVDVKLAFSDKTNYKRSDLVPNYVPTKKIGFILAHILSDASHCSHKMLFRDYLIWFMQTLKYCAENEHILWFVKPHPAAKVYGEDGIIEDILMRNEFKNIQLCPIDFSTASLVECADCIITMQGTAGLEFACAGIPVILSGKPYYSGHGFTKDCESIVDYKKTILNAHCIEKLSDSEVSTAMKILAAYQKFIITDNLVFDSDLLAKIWGYKGSVGNEVLETFSSRLAKVDIANEPQYKRTLNELNSMAVH